MNRFKWLIITITLALVAIGATTLAALKPYAAQENSNPTKSTQTQTRPQLDKEQYPIADYQAQDVAQKEQSSKRQAKNSKYDRKNTVPSPELSGKNDGAQRYDDWEVRLPALPVSESDLIVTGEVTNAQAYLSNDKSGVYSEFSITITEIIKNKGQETLSQGAAIVAEREGGRVRYPDGEVWLFIIVGQNIPGVGKHYVFFLKRNADGNDYTLLTGYELREGSVFALDMPEPTSKFGAYNYTGQVTFLEQLRRTSHN